MRDDIKNPFSNNPAAGWLLRDVRKTPSVLVLAVSTALAVLSAGLVANVPAAGADEEKLIAGKKPVAARPGPRGPVGPDVPLTEAERKLFARDARITVEGFTAKAVQAACDRAAKTADKKRVVFLPAGRYEFARTVNVPGGIVILGAGPKTHCVSRDRRKALFRVAAPNVRITRLRLEGPGKTRHVKDNSTGVSVSAENVRIDHCEIFALCRGVNFSGGGGQLDHSHIHHCIRDGLGYGVSLYSGARALICDNDFGPCRHHLASNGALDWSSPKRVGRYVHKPGVRKTHWEFVHNRVYGDDKTDYHRHWAVDTHPGMDGTFVVENNLFENIRMGLGIRDGSGVIRGNLFRNFKGYKAVAIIITYGKHNGIVVEGTMPRDIEISANRFEKVPQKYRIGKAERITIDGRLVEKTRAERKGPAPKIRRLKPMAEPAAEADRRKDTSAAVPDDRLLPLGFKVAGYPTFEALAKEFRKHHQQSEKIRNSDGSWGTGYGRVVSPPIYHPLVRDTARRVLGYIDAHHATGEAIYKQRAREGLEYLLKVQRPDGQFIWWIGDPKRGRVETKGRRPRWDGSSLYVTSIPAAAFIKGYKLFKDARYLAAANKACDYLRAMPNVPKANYDLFATWALAANYDVTGKKAYLDRAIGFALYSIGKGGSGYQLRSGGWSDRHHQQIWYHSINLRGLVTLLSVIPENHPHRDKIRKAAYKALNHVRSRQKADGSMLARPEHTRGAWRTTFAAQSIAIIAMRLDWPVTDSLHLAAKGISKGRRNPVGTKGERGDYIMAIGSLMQAYKHAAAAERTKPDKTTQPAATAPASTGYKPLPAGESRVRLWDLGRKYTYKHYWPKKQWEDRKNWILVPYGKTKDYNFRGDCMLEGPNFWLSLHSSTHDACFLYNKVDKEGTPSRHNELYRSYDQPGGLRTYCSGYEYNRIIRNDSGDIIVESRTRTRRRKGVGVYLVNRYRVQASKPWLEIEPMNEMSSEQGMHGESRIHISPHSLPGGQDFLADAWKHPPDKSVYHPHTSRMLLDLIMDDDCIWAMMWKTTGKIPSRHRHPYFEHRSRSDNCRGGWPAGWQRIGEGKSSQIFTAPFVKYRSEKLIIGVLRIGHWHYQKIDSSVRAGEDYHGRFRYAYRRKVKGSPFSTGKRWWPMHPGKWRMIGCIDGKHHTQQVTVTKADVGKSQFTFRSLAAGTLEYIVFYLYDRTDQTPKDVHTVMDIYRRGIGGSRAEELSK